MVLRHMMRAVLAPAVGMLLLAASSEAATVNAAVFLAGCPGPIFVSADTTVTGSAVVSGDCTVGTIGTPQINFDKANLSFAGFFEVTGDASSMMVSKSQIATGTDLTLDSQGPMTIRGSKLTAKGGTLHLPPRGGLTATGSSLVAQGDVRVGGSGNLLEVSDSTLWAGGLMLVAPGPEPAAPFNLIRSTLSATTRLTVGGQPSALSIDASTLEVLGAGAQLLVAPGGGGPQGPPVTISNGTKLKAPAGSIFAAGFATFTVEDAKFFSGGASSFFGMLLGGNSYAYRRTQLTSTRSGIVFTAGVVTPPVVEDCQVLAAGVSNFSFQGVGILFGGRFLPEISGSQLQATAGGITIVGSDGELSIMTSSLQARHATGIAIGTGVVRTIVDSKLDSPIGPIAFRGFNQLEITGSKLTAMNAGGILLSGGISDVTSSVFATRGPLTIQNLGSTVAASSIKADAGLLTETSGGGNSVLTASGVRGASIIVRSFDDTIVTDNNLAAAAYEFSAAGTCTSTGNVPNIPCN